MTRAGIPNSYDKDDDDAERMIRMMIQGMMTINNVNLS